MHHLQPPPANLAPLKDYRLGGSSDGATNHSFDSYTQSDHTREPSASSVNLEDEILEDDTKRLSFTHSQTPTAVSGSSSVSKEQNGEKHLRKAVPYRSAEGITWWLDSCDTKKNCVDLGETIRDAMIPPGLPFEGFLPDDQLNAIMTTENIVAELRRTDEHLTDTSTVLEYSALAEKILEWQDPGRRGTSRRALFAILCLLNLALSIVDFIKEDLFDCDMPFLVNSNGMFRRRDSSHSPINLFKSWKRRDQEQFQTYQGSIFVPYFEFSKSSGSKIIQLCLSPGTKLPFVEDKSAKQVVLTGGSSTVRKIRLHDAHHDLEQSPLYLASKELRYSCADDDYHEVAAYKRLKHIQNPHIIQLLATYTQGGHLNIVFPWADGNLYDFWCTHFPETTQLSRGHELSRWVSAQTLGLADALLSIHHLDIDEYNVECLSDHDQSKTHGRHGDIKPENILWFRDSTGNTVYGILKISDLGSADFHSTGSKSVGVSNMYAFTETYKAPEFDMEARVSPRYDIWSFGCLLMQFVIWYLDGAVGVKSFSEKRLLESNRAIRADDFFNVYSDENKMTTRAKPSVREEFSRLRQHPDCSDLFIDLLFLIQSKLLRLKSTERASCDQIVEDLRDINKRCEKDADYCTKRSFGPIKKVPTDLSESVDLNLSRRMQDEYKATFRGVDVNRGKDQSTASDEGAMGSDLMPDTIPSTLPSLHDEQETSDSGTEHCPELYQKNLDLGIQKQDEDKGDGSTGPRHWLQSLMYLLFGCFMPPRQ